MGFVGFLGLRGVFPNSGFLLGLRRTFEGMRTMQEEHL